MCSDNSCCCFFGEGEFGVFCLFFVIVEGSAVKGVLITVVVVFLGRGSLLFFVCFSLLLRGSAVKSVLITYDAMNLNK